MNYSRNIPDWQQYNALQSGGTDAPSATMATAPMGPNTNPGHPFVPSISPSSMGGMNPATDCLGKAQADSNFASRNYQTPPNVPNGCNNLGTSSLSSMVHMTNCVGHYGSANNMNPMMEDMNNAMDNRRGVMNEEMTHRGNISMNNGSASHMVGPNLNVNNNMGVPNPRMPPTNPMAPNRQLPFMPCKGTCCSMPDPSVAYQSWDKFGYQSSVPFRDNMNVSNYNMDDRRFRGGNINFRKDAFSIKAPNSSNQFHIDQRGTFPDYKYRKDPTTVSRNYQQSSMILPNYPLQNYNVPGDYQKYPHHYPMKNYAACGAPMANAPTNSMMLKYQDSAKQAQYQSNNMMRNGIMVQGTGAVPLMQNPYYSAQSAAPLREYPREGQEGVDTSINRIQPPQGNTMHAVSPKHQMYRQKFAIQRYSLENQLRELMQMPGYMSNPKYKECTMRYRELLKLQRTVEFQSSIHESSMNSNAAVGPPISPINLQFDQNGVLINSNYLSTNFPESPCPVNAQKKPDAIAQQQNIQMIGQTCSGQSESPTANHQKIDQRQEFPTQTMSPLHLSKENKTFADKPDLDVRQFLATWDESEEDENTTANVLGRVDGPVAVVEFADLNLLQGNSTNQTNNESGSSVLNNEKVVSVVGCISGDGSEVPTIHIVDNLDNKIVVEKLENALSGITNNNIKCIHELINKHNYLTKPSDKQADKSGKNDDGEQLNTKIQKSCTEKSADSSKQNEINNMELNNNDDLSLPELSTTVVTPPSTTLNSPTHSDNVLRMSTNPIDIVQNSQTISFAQSPLKNTAYENGRPMRKSSQDGLQFDEVMNNILGTSESSKQKKKDSCCTKTSQKSDGNTLEYEEADRNELLPREWFSPSSVQYDSEKASKNNSLDNAVLNTNYKEVTPSASKNLINENNSSNSKLQVSKSSMQADDSRQSKQDESNTIEKSAADNTVRDDSLFCSLQEREKYISISLGDDQFYTETTFSSSSNIIPLIPDEDSEEPRMPVPPMEGNCLTKIIKDSSPITDLNVLGSDDEKIDKVDDIWMEFTCIDKNLGDNFEMDMEVSGKEKYSQLDKIKKVLQQKKKSKNISEVKDSIEDNRQISMGSDQSHLCSSPKISDSNSKKRRGSKGNCKVNEYLEEKLKSCFDSTKTRLRESRWRSKSVEPDVGNGRDQMELLNEFKRLKRKRSIGNPPDKDNMRDLLVQRMKASQSNSSDNNQIKDMDVRESITNNEGKATEESQSSAIIHSSKPNETIQDFDNYLETDSKKLKSSDFEIQLTNLNLCINEQDIKKGLLTLKDKKRNANSDAMDGIKIEINLSCSDNKHSVKRVVSSESSNVKDNAMKDNIPSHTELNDEETDKETTCDPIKTESITMARNLRKKSSDDIKLCAESTDGSSATSKQNVKLPHKTKSNCACLHNDSHPLNCTECLIPVIVDKHKNTGQEKLKEDSCLDRSQRLEKLSNDSTKKKVEFAMVNKMFDFTEHSSRTKLLKNLPNFRFGADNNFLYTTKLFECTKNSKDNFDDGTFYNNIKYPNLLTSLNIDSFIPKHSVPSGSSNKRFTDKLMNFNISEFDTSPYGTNPLTFKNYASETNYPQKSIIPQCEELEIPSGFFNPAFTNLDDCDNMNTVPVYTTKDGKIKYSPNRRYTYQVLVKEARERDNRSLLYDFDGPHARYRESWKRKSDHDKWRTDGSSKSKLSKDTSGQVFKHKKHKHKSVCNSPDKVESDTIRDCSVIAVAPSNTSVECDKKITTEVLCDAKTERSLNQDLARPDLVLETTDLKDKDHHRSKLDEVVEEVPLEYIVDNENRSKVDEVFEEVPLEYIVDNENRTTVIKQLGSLSVDNKVMDYDNNLDVSVDGAEYSAPDRSIDFENHSKCPEMTNCPSVIQRDDSGSNLDKEVGQVPVDDSIHEVCETDVESSLYPKEGVLRHMKTMTIIPLPSVVGGDETSKDESKVAPADEIFHEETASSGKDVKSRRNSTPIIERCQQSVIMPRRKSLESDVLITSYLSQDNQSDNRQNEKIQEITNIQEDLDEGSDDNVFLSVPIIPTDTYYETKEIVKVTETEVILDSPKNVQEESDFQQINVDESITVGSEMHIKSPPNVTHEIKDSDNLLNNTEHVDTIMYMAETKSEQISESKNDNEISDYAVVTAAETVSDESEEAGKFLENTRFECSENMCLEYENIIVKEKKEVEEVQQEKILTNENQEVDETEARQIHKLDYMNFMEPVLDQQDEVQNFRCEEVETTTEESVLPEIEVAKERDEEEETREAPIIDEQSENLTLQELPSEVICHQTVSQEIQDTNKVVPKLVIRKSDSFSQIFSQSKLPFVESNVESRSTKVDSHTKHPKIPKMIIRNASSRPNTPTIQEISQSSTKIRTKPEEKWKESGGSVSMNESESKVPKMKINLEDKLPKVVTESVNSLEMQKTIPKMKIKKVRSSTPQIMDKKPTKRKYSEDLKNDVEIKKTTSKSYTELSEEIPKLKITKDSSCVLSSKIMRKRSNSSTLQTYSKRSKKYHRVGSQYEEPMNLSEYECDTSDLLPKSEKVPKVIIKRTSTRSEFKCELRKNKKHSSQWQPRVTLRRSWILDCMAKKLRHMKVALKLATPRRLDRICSQNNTDPNKLQWDKFISDLKKQSKLAASASDIFPVDLTNSRKRENVLSFIETNSDSDDSTSSKFFMTSKSFDENMNSRDKVENARDISGPVIKDEKDEYISDDACFENILPRHENELNCEKSLQLCPLINNDSSYTKFSTLSTSENLCFEIPHAPFEDTTINTDSDIVFPKNMKLGDLSKSKSSSTCDMSLENIKGDFVIKVESSDESQTTIEILPASPDTSQEGLDTSSSRDAPPKISANNETPTGLGMELNENNMENLEPPVLQPKDIGEDAYDNAVDNITVRVENGRLKSKSGSRNEHSHSLSKHHRTHSNFVESKFKTQDHEPRTKRSNSEEQDSRKSKSQSSKWSRETQSYSDMLAKEVLAAKETLRRCFRKCRSKDGLMCNTRPKMVTEKKQGSSISADSLKRSREHASLSKDDNKRAKVTTNKSNIDETQLSRHSSRSTSNQQRPAEGTRSECNVQIALPQFFDTTISLKSIKNSSRDANKIAKDGLDNAKVTKKLAVSDPTNRQFVHSFQKAIQVIDEMNKVTPYMKTPSSKPGELMQQDLSDCDIKADDQTKEEMPVLEPQVNVQFETSPDRDTSRSPPVITNQDTTDVNLDLPKNNTDKVELHESEDHVKSTKIKQEPDMTVADVIRELAFHEKATIKHRRYCILCERWFPSVLRHQRHLSGYQHRHMELMQRRTIHALFTLFTGRPCPKLLPADINRTDCTPGEATPLQIVVQDIVMDCDGVRTDKKKQNENNT